MNTIAGDYITAHFASITGNWNKYTMMYVNEKKIPKGTKRIQIKIVYREGEPQNLILKFEGGPTGFESYYIKDLLHIDTFPKPRYFCICAGTVNTWDECKVKWNDIIDFLNRNGFSIKIG